MKSRWLGYLQLARVPNTITAAADVLAGFLYAGGGAVDCLPAAVLSLASMCLYGGGVALNDVCDATRDACERPMRPIPSGRIARPAALAFSWSLLAAGLALAAVVSAHAGVLAAMLVASILLYDATSKDRMIAPALMGACRALNLLMGMSAVSLELTTTAFVPAALMWMYVTSLTRFARREAGESVRRDLIGGALGVTLAVVGLGALLPFGVAANVHFLVPVGGLAVVLAWVGVRAVRHASPLAVQSAVRTFVVSIVVFDGCLVWATRGPQQATWVLGLLVPVALLGRVFRVT